MLDQHSAPPRPQPKILRRKPQEVHITSHLPPTDISLQMPVAPEPHTEITFNKTKFSGLPELEFDLEEEIAPAKTGKTRAFPNSGVERSTLLHMQNEALGQIRCDWGVK